MTGLRHPKTTRGAAAWLTALICVGPADAQMRSDWQAHVMLASDYRRYGLSQVDSGVAVQAGADYRHYTGFFAGGAVNNVGYAPGRFDTGSDVQLNAYAGFGRDFAAWDFNGVLHRYAYPGAVADYDYSAVSVSGVFRDRFVASLSYTDALFARWGPALDYELGLIWPLVRDTELTVTVGRFQARDLGGTEYTHWNVGLSRIFRRFGLDLRYYGTSLPRALPIGDPGGQEWVLSASYAVARKG